MGQYMRGCDGFYKFGIPWLQGITSSLVDIFTAGSGIAQDASCSPTTRRSIPPRITRRPRSCELGQFQARPELTAVFCTFARKISTYDLPSFLLAMLLGVAERIMLDG